MQDMGDMLSCHTHVESCHTHVRHMCQCVTWFIHKCDTRETYVWHAVMSHICVTYVSVCDMTHSQVWHVRHVCDMPSCHTHVRHMCQCVTRLIHKCDTRETCVTRLLYKCDMIAKYHTLTHTDTHTPEVHFRRAARCHSWPSRHSPCGEFSKVSTIVM